MAPSSNILAALPSTDKQIKGVTLIEQFYMNINRKRKSHTKKIKVELNERGIFMRRESINQKEVIEQLIRIEDIIGSSCSTCLRQSANNRLNSCTCLNEFDEQQHNNNQLSYNDSKDFSVYLYIYAYVREEQPLRRFRTVRILKFDSFHSYEENLKAAELWQQTLKLNKQYSLGMSHIERKTLLILLNPKSGSGKGRQMFENQVIPVLKEADIQYELIITAHANYAREWIKQHKDLFDNYYGIVVASGDGLFHELINGLMEHTDWQNLTRCLPLGIIPCGSGNGLAKSIAYYCNEPYEPNRIISSTLACVSGQSAPLDIVHIELVKNDAVVQMYSFLSIGWGFIADIDIESEKLRTFGSQRFAFWSVYRLLNLRTYKGKLSYLPCYDRQQKQQQSAKEEVLVEEGEIRTDQINSTAHDQEPTKSFQDTLDDDGNIFYDALLDNEFIDMVSQASPKSKKDSWQSLKTTFHSIEEHSTNSLHSNTTNILNKVDAVKSQFKSISPKSSLPSINTPIPDTWHSEEGEYIMIHAANTTHLATDCFFAPQSKLNDGIIYLVIVRAGISRTQLLKFLLNLNSGTHLSVAPKSCLEMVPVKAFRIEPYDSSGIITVDGEKVDCDTLQAEILPGLIQVMVSNTSIQ